MKPGHQASGGRDRPLDVLYLKQRFHPEPSPLRGLDYALEIKRHGIDLRVFTGFPFYPFDHLHEGYRQRLHSQESISGVSVHRSPLIGGNTGSALRRVLSYTSLSVAAPLNAMRLNLRPDAVLTTLGPGTFAPSAALVARRYRCPLILEVQDLWPESLLASGMWPTWAPLKPIEATLQAVYERADAVICLSEGCRSILISRGAKPSSTHCVYNWAPEPVASNADRSRADEIVRAMGGRDYFCYTGSLGPLQGVDKMIDATSMVEGDVGLLIVGAGRESERLREQSAKAGKFVLMVGQESPAVAALVAAQSLAQVLYLERSPLDESAVPSKLSSYMRAGAPIVVAAGGETGQLARRAGAGPVLLPGDTVQLADAFTSVAVATLARRAGWVENARTFCSTNLDFSSNVARIADIIVTAVDGGSHRRQ